MIRAIVVLATALLFLTACSTSLQPAPLQPRDATGWQSLSRTELDAVRAAIRAAHPGAIDPEAPGFAVLVDEAHHDAHGLVPRIDGYDAMLAVVRSYTSRFLDGHLLYTDDQRGDAVPRHAGWVAQHRGRDVVVGAVMPEWPIALPPIGARLLECDGMAPERLLRERTVPFVHWREPMSDRVVSLLTAVQLPGLELRHCSFRLTDDRVVDLPQTYATTPANGWWDLIFSLPSAPQKVNEHTLQGGVLWIQAARFSIAGPQVEALERQLTELRSIGSSLHTIVFDLRGNSGGDSSVGDRVFEAATGGLVFDRSGAEALPQTYAMWRVSPLNVEMLDERIGWMTQARGAQDSSVVWQRSLLARMRAALAAGQPWVQQEGGPLFTRAEVARRGGRLLRHADARVVLVTDRLCASACLDMADLVRSVPGSVHVGETTASDRVYIDVGRVRLPSGNHLVVPMKVWRNRVRGDAEPLVPDRQLSLEELDESTLRSAVLQAAQEQVVR